MQLYKLRKIGQFDNIKEGDHILIKWSDFFIKHHEGSKKLMLYQIAEIKEETKEIILDEEKNHYFNYELYLKNESNAKEVYLLKESSKSLDADIKTLELSVRTENCLRRAGVNTIEELKNKKDLKTIRNIGRRSLEEIQNKLNKF